MQLKEKFSSIKKFKFILVAVLAILAVLLLISGVKDCLRYAPVKEKGVEVIATASKIVESLDSENMDEYEVYVDYEYQGQSYTVYYKTYKTYVKAQAVDTVTIVINPDNPGEKLETLRSNMVLSIVFGLMFLATAVSATGIRQCEDQIVSHGMSLEKVRIELLSQIRHRRGAAWLLTVGIGLIVFWWLFRNALSPWMAVAGAVLLILGGRRLIRDLKDRSDVENGRIKLRQDPLMKKYVDSDTDSDSCLLVFGPEEDRWEISVTRDEFENAGSADFAVSIVAEGRKDAIARYRKTANGWLSCAFSNPYRKGH